MLSCDEEATEDFDAGLCYPKCSPGFNGVGPVCWQDCRGLVNTNCAAGCAVNSTVCGNTIKEQILGPILLAANIAAAVVTGGGSTAAVAAGKSVQVSIKLATGGVKVLTSTTRIGGLALRAVSALQKAKKAVQVSKTVTKYTKVLKKIKKAKKAYENYVDPPVYKYYKDTQSFTKELADQVKSYQDAFSGDFAAQTSPEIAAAVDDRYGAGTPLASFIKKSWSDISLQVMAKEMAAETVSQVLSVAAAVDPTGILDVVNAYNKPKCIPIDPLPCTSFAVKC